jgi:pyruvate/2-oxoglutarate dehydrogenase complex dihydrolipoamide dehydrogenase (E3) component
VSAATERVSGGKASAEPLVLPEDEFNRVLVSRAHPGAWINPAPRGKYNLVVIGAGTAGLVSAAGGAGLGAKVALIERNLLGGDCLNVGCVPSKALISASRIAAQARAGDRYGVHSGSVSVDFAEVMRRMRRLRAQLSVADSAERFKGLGVDVYLGEGRLSGPDSVEVAGQKLKFARAVLATGTRPAAPSIEGLETGGYLTNETLFSLTELPKRLAVIGAGPIGSEMAQAFCRFGSEVTLIEEAQHILLREDADSAAIVQKRIRKEGVRLICGSRIARIEKREAVKIVHLSAGSEEHGIACDEILLAVGRIPNLEGLGLQAAGVAYDSSGIKVDDGLRTANPRVYAAGDVCSRFKFTHTADALARIVLTNALFAGRRKASALNVPWCTYTSPEIAHVGLYERDAAEAGIEVTTITVPLSEVDRAVLDGQDEGFVRIHLKKGGDRILGATIVAEHAGEMISELTLAMTADVGLGAIANVIHPYPTQSDAIRKAGDAYNRTRLTPAISRLFRLWLGLRRRVSLIR